MTTRETSVSSVKKVKVGPVTFGAGRLVLIAGPCVIESEAHALSHARRIQRIAARLRIPYIFKSSYDKANRSSGESFRGPGLKSGLAVLAKVKAETGLPVLSDVHSIEEIDAAARVLDVLQIPAFLSRQTDLLVAAAKTGKVVNVKKGQFLAPEDMKNAVDKIRKAGSDKILLTERGVSFGYRTLVTDFRSLVIMRQFGFPVIFDATHSVQQPGGLGKSTGGDRRFVPPLARAAVAVGCDGIFMEVHENPDSAPSDGPNMVRLADLEALLESLVRIREASSNGA